MVASSPKAKCVTHLGGGKGQVCTGLGTVTEWSTAGAESGAVGIRGWERQMCNSPGIQGLGGSSGIPSQGDWWLCRCNICVPVLSEFSQMGDNPRAG